MNCETKYTIPHISCNLNSKGNKGRKTENSWRINKYVCEGKAILQTFKFEHIWVNLGSKYISTSAKLEIS